MEYQGNSLVKFLRLPPVESIRPVATDLVTPRRIPDGLFEVLYQGQESPSPLLIEVESHPDTDAGRQMLEDILLVRLTYQVFLDAVLIVLSPRGNRDAPDFVEFVTPGGTVAGLIRWRVIKMWELDAEDLFALNDPGLVPWITLSRTEQPPREFLQRCRDLLDLAPPTERVSELKAVTSVFASIRYNEIDVAEFFSGVQNMIASPFLDKVFEILEAKAAASAEAKVAARVEKLVELAEMRAAELAEAREHALAEFRIQEGKRAALREMVIDLLTGRFSGPFGEIASKINREEDPNRLKELVRLASRAESLHEFEKQL